MLNTDGGSGKKLGLICKQQDSDNVRGLTGNLEHGVDRADSSCLTHGCQKRHQRDTISSETNLCSLSWTFSSDKRKNSKNNLIHLKCTFTNITDARTKGNKQVTFSHGNKGTEEEQKPARRKGTSPAGQALLSSAQSPVSVHAGLLRERA